MTTFPEDTEEYWEAFKEYDRLNARMWHSVRLQWELKAFRDSIGCRTSQSSKAPNPAKAQNHWALTTTGPTDRRGLTFAPLEIREMIFSNAHYEAVPAFSKRSTFYVEWLVQFLYEDIWVLKLTERGATDKEVYKIVEKLVIHCKSVIS